MIKKIAVLICGPERFLPLVIENLKTTLSDYDYDNFIFMWDEDKDNRAVNTSSDNLLLYKKNSKVFILHKPFDEEGINHKYGKEVLGHSNKKAMLGMFYSISSLCKQLKMSPDFDEYSHILRVRTDNLFFDSNFLKDYNCNDILVPDNPMIPSSWISDHIMLCKKNDFYKIWYFSSINNLNFLFKLSSSNPELLLKFRCYFLLRKINKKFKRYQDYHIVYTSNDSEPEYMKEIMLGNVESVFTLHPDLNKRRGFYEMKNKIRKQDEKSIKKRLSSSFFGRLIITLIRYSR